MHKEFLMGNAAIAMGAVAAGLTLRELHFIGVCRVIIQLSHSRPPARSLSLRLFLRLWLLRSDSLAPL